ncbi:MAG: efflux RND transporter periplasmic adaptor subunit [Acidobacteriota bacterium]
MSVQADPASDLQALRIDRNRGRKRSRRRQGSGGLPPWLPRLIGLLALLLVVWLAWRPLTRLHARLTLPTVSVIEVVESSPASAGAVAGTAANGHVVAARRAALSTDIVGRIAELFITEGSRVRKGDVLARLDASQQRADLTRSEADLAVAQQELARSDTAVAAARAQLRRTQQSAEASRAALDEASSRQRLARSDHERTRRLVDSGVSPRRELDEATTTLEAADASLASARAVLAAEEASVADARVQVTLSEADRSLAEARVESAEAAVGVARANLDKTEVRAPFDGVVVLKDAELGEVVSPNVTGGASTRGAVCTLVDLDSLEVQVELPETNLDSVKIGAPVQVYPDSAPGTTLPGKVDRIWPTAVREKATVELRVALLSGADDLRPDMGVRAVFLPEGRSVEERRSSEPVLLLPETAVIERGGRRGVLVVEGDRVRFTDVTLGESRSGRVIVESGLRPRQRIVAEPSSELDDGDRIRVESSS